MLLDDLLEAVDVDVACLVDINLLEGFLEEEEPSRTLRHQLSPDSEQN